MSEVFQRLEADGQRSEEAERVEVGVTATDPEVKTDVRPTVRTVGRDQPDLVTGVDVVSHADGR